MQNAAVACVGNPLPALSGDGMPVHTARTAPPYGSIQRVTHTRYLAYGRYEDTHEPTWPSMY
eukprot:3704588-Prymnesium_polylepis.2